MMDDQIKHMVNRFLGWRLPVDFRPDAGISFKSVFPKGERRDRMPYRTNLFNARQADAMVRFMVEGLATRPTADLGDDGELIRKLSDADKRWSLNPAVVEMIEEARDRLEQLREALALSASRFELHGHRGSAAEARAVLSRSGG